MAAVNYSDNIIGLQGGTYVRIITADPVNGSTWEVVASASTPFHGAVLVEI